MLFLLNCVSRERVTKKFEICAMPVYIILISTIHIVVSINLVAKG